MDELFGAPMENIAAVLTVAFGLAVAYLLYIRLPGPHLGPHGFSQRATQTRTEPADPRRIDARNCHHLQRIHRRRLCHLQHQKHRRRFAPIRRRVARRGRGLGGLGGSCPARRIFGGGFSRTHPRTRRRCEHRRRATRPYRGRGGHKPRKPAVRILGTAGGSGPTTG